MITDYSTSCISTDSVSISESEVSSSEYTNCDEYSSVSSSNQNENDISSSRSKTNSDSSSHETNSKFPQKSNRKKKKKFVCVFCFLSFFLILCVNVIAMIILSSTLLSNNTLKEEFVYEMFYYDFINNETVQGEIKYEKKVRGYSFRDENGAGVVYPISFRDGKETEVKIEGECYCCYECMDDNDCDGYCIDNMCVDCTNSYDCLAGLVCNRGRCLSGVCVDHNECEEDEICNIEGQCVKGCRSDDVCRIKEICDWDGNCRKGCRVDDECKNGHICSSGNCIKGCRGNFDCDNYETVCIHNQCIRVDTAMVCESDNECESGSVCNYDYMICVQRRTETLIYRKTTIPKMKCSWKKIITLAVMATAVYVATLFGDEKVQEECKKECAEQSDSILDTEVKNIEVTPTKRKLIYHERSNCVGKCIPLETLESDSKPKRYADKFCSNQELKKLMSTVDDVDVDEMFETNLYVYCTGLKYGFTHPENNWMEIQICDLDLSSIDCKQESK